MNPKPNSVSPVVTEKPAGGSVVLAWLFVGVPLAWGISQTFLKALTLFK